ncbi:hypothetical protein ACHAW5_008754 [Stephanodiscus triporus]|uniref:Uncharacterized protein n=1 Tax=Stephanodiscus triporus TaxID=2934178 RepID=A0ABD3Q1L2_9STRA
MDRVVLRAPTAVVGGAPRGGGSESSSLPSSSLSAATAVLVVAVAIAIRRVVVGDDGATTTTALACSCAAMMSAASFLLLAASSSSSSSSSGDPRLIPLLRRFFRRRSFVEAAVEITPLGVQLVSVYGTPSIPPSRGGDAWTTTTTTTTGNDCLRREECEDVRLVVHAFLPRCRIIDVVVLEVVWPHRVWSQVVFRVVANGPDHRDDVILFDRSPGGGDTSHLREGGIPPPPGAGEGLTRDRSTTAVRDLLRSGRVSIVPAFHPHECRGKLTYVQCLAVQAELEGLLGISSKRRVATT